jgi:putative transport protein
MGLIFGWLHSRRPRIGYIPEPALWIFDTLGLATFLGIIGLAAGPTFISGLKQVGWGIAVAGLVVAILPHIIGLFFGRFILKMNPVILLGAQSGAGTTTTALKAIQEAADSKLPVLGYTVPYALGNILLTAWGPVIVSLMRL